MDIAGYIVKFLIKNKYCSLPGLGSFDLVKIPALVNPEEKEIKPPTYKVSFSPIGTIEDSLASFMASFENVSISNASNHLKEFCIKVKEDLAQNGQFQIANLGILTMHNHQISFDQTHELDLGLFPQTLLPLEMKTNPNKKLDFSYPAAQRSYRRKKLNPVKFLLPALIVLILCVVSYFVYQNYSESGVDESANQSAGSSALSNNPVSTAPIPDSSAYSPAAGNGALPLYKVAVFASNLENTATAKAGKWKKFGHLTEVHHQNGNFVVTILASHPQNDTTMLKDSLRRFFNLKGMVYILK